MIWLLRVEATWACPDINGLLDRNCDQRLEIVTFGDSITYGTKDEENGGYPGRLARIFPSAVVYNLGYPGETTNNGQGRAAREFPSFASADFFVVLEGVNDYWLASRSASRTRTNLLAMIRSGNNTGAFSLLGNLTDVKRSYQRPWVLSVNDEILVYRNIDFFSLGTGILHSDNLHPNGDGYQAMAQLVAGVLQAVSAANRPLDSDTDGIYDFAESKFGSDPFDADTDNDGISDGDEVFVYGSSPLLLDSDGDGMDDPDEIAIGADPGDPRPGSPTLKTLEIIPDSEGDV